MLFDGSGGHAPPSARHLFPDSAGRLVRLFRFPFRLGQRGIAPLCARPPYQPRRQVELAERHVLHAVGPRQLPAVPWTLQPLMYSLMYYRIRPMSSDIGCSLLVARVVALRSDDLLDLGEAEEAVAEHMLAPEGPEAVKHAAVHLEAGTMRVPAIRILP